MLVDFPKDGRRGVYLSDRSVAVMLVAVKGLDGLTGLEREESKKWACEKFVVDGDLGG